MNTSLKRTRDRLNDRYETAKWNARQGAQQAKDKIRGKMAEPITFPWKKK